MKPTSPNNDQRGNTNYLAGLAAEDAVANQYSARGMRFLARRWRGQAGEIDLIFASEKVVVFVEVKKSKTTARAAAALSINQQQRIMATAQEYLASVQKSQDSDMRFDVALVDGQGQIEILENAITA